MVETDSSVLDMRIHQPSLLLEKSASLGTALLRLLPAEKAHDLGIFMLEKGVMDLLPAPRLPSLSGLGVDVASIGQLSHPVGLAAGFDKHGRAMDGFRQMGLSFLEVGTVTPRPQSGNPKPRMFRLPDQLGIINRMGFNSDGSEVVASRLRQRGWDHSSCPLGINVGKNKDTSAEDALGDFLHGLQTFEAFGRYFVVNVSSPNTPGLRDLAGKEFLGQLASEASHLMGRLWVKLDPDMPKKKFQQTIQAICDFGYQGVILCNTHRVAAPEVGGMSGHSLSSLSQSRLEWAYEVHKGRLLMIASGGIFSGLDVYERLIRGASAVQIYSALVYRGPFAVYNILKELVAQMRLRGVSCLSDIIGTFYD